MRCSLNSIVQAFDSRKMLLVFVPFLIYMSNGREISSGDTVPTVFVSINLVKHGTIFLDDLHDYVPYDNLPYYVSEQKGHIVSNYPIFPSIMAVPIFAPFVWMGLLPNQIGDLVWRYISAMAGAFYTSLSVLFMYLALRRLIDKHGAFMLSVAYALGTALWPIAGQSLWQHGPSVFWFTLSFYCIIRATQSDRYNEIIKFLIIGGFACGATVLCRNINLIGAFFMCGAILFLFPKRAVVFILPASILIALLFIYNYSLFGTWNGGYEELLKLQWELDRIDTGRWATPIHIGLAGQLISPSRGIFIFSPFLIFSFIGIWSIRKKEGMDWKFVMFTIPIPILMLLIFSKYSVWWGGNSHYGPRYQIETYPFLILYIASIWSWIERNRYIYISFIILLLYSIFIQAVGAFCYPCSWAAYPVSLAMDKDRLWSWSYNQICTCIKDGIHLPFQ